MNPPSLGDPEGSDPDAMLTDSAQVVSMNNKPTELARDFSTPSLPHEPSSTDIIASGKRKAGLAQPDDSIPKKRVRVDEDHVQGPGIAQSSVVDRATQLPAEIWHHIFIFVPPRALGRLFLVNKLFYTFLHPNPFFGISSYCSLPHAPPHGALKPVNPNAIWRASRRLFWPRMPTPLKDKSELDMWRLVCSVSCQFCSFKGNIHNHEANDVWHRGPGAKGVSPVFPFSVFVCGNCLSSKAVKEIDILLSPSIPSPLLPALPMVFITDEQHVIPPSVMQSETLPSKSQVTKVYWSDHLEQIKVEFETVKLLGSAAAEEWIKGLETRGKEALADASRWEKWDLAGGVHQMQTNLSSLSPILGTAKVAKSHPSLLQFQGRHSLENSPQSQSCGERSRHVSEQFGISALAPKADANGSQSRPLVQQKRSKEEVAELKTKRRAEIERRALLLNPPLAPSVLAHIPSFQAALQIITPLDENAWDLLKPRLLAQREKAELREKESDANSRALREKLDIKKERTVVKETRVVTDKDWDEIQGPLRGRISNFADEIIHDGWGNGEKVRKKSIPQFAADVLVYVRKRFYAEVAKDAAAAVAAGLEPTIDPPEGPWTRKLTLENMKWIFDVKIKPHTEPRRKELFLCNGCPGNTKYYGFEGVVQHYAAKHTGALSAGNVVVHWRAEWPEVPPFNPDPRHSITQQQNQASAAPYPSHATQLNPNYPAYSHGASLAGIPPAHVYGAPMPLHQLGPEQHASFPPMHHHEPDAPAYGIPQPPPYYGQYTYSGGHPSYPPGPLYGTSNVPHGLSGSYSGYHSYPVPQGPYSSQTPGDSYKTRLNAMAKVAKATWGKVAGVKDLPAAVKICVVVHHIAKMFQNDFAEPAPLAMLVDALSTRKEMRPIRSTNGLACKACAIGNLAPERPNFSLPQLTNHFSKHHEGGSESQGGQPMDWRINMILLPDMTVLRKLNKILENNRPAFDLVADTLPWAFEVQPNTALKSQAWQKVTESSRTGTPRGLDHASEHLRNDGAPQRGPDVSGHNHQSQATGTSRREVTQQVAKQESHTKHDAHDSPSVRAAPPNTVPNLRPASEVYAPPQQKRSVEQMQSQIELSGPAPPYSSSGDRHGGLDTASQGLVQRDQPRVPSNEGPERRERPKSTHDQHASRTQPSTRIDYRDVEPRRHMTVPDAQLHYGSTPRGGPSVPPPSNAAASGASDDGFSLLNALESHLEQEHEEVIYVDTSGRELGRASRPIQTRPRSRRIVYRDDSEAEIQHQAPSSRYDRYQSAGYNSRGTGSRYGSHAYTRHADHISHAVYYDEPRPPPGPAAEAYELVEIRDPQGDYFIRRPIRRDESEHYARDIRLLRRDSEMYPPYRPTDDRAIARPVAYVTDHRTTPLVSTRSTTGVAYESYDPRQPTPGPRDPPVYQSQR